MITEIMIKKFFIGLLLCLICNSCIVLKFYSDKPGEQPMYLISTSVTSFNNSDTLKIVRNGQIILKDTVGNEYILNGNKLK